MKTIKTTIVILALSILTIACNKDDAPLTPPVAIVPEQNPLPEFLKTTGFDQKMTPYINSVTFEQGFSFIPLVSGTMTAIVVKLPDTNTNVRVTVWDKTNATILLTENINVTAADIGITKNITP